MLDDEDPTAQAIIWYVWCCPECGEMQECDPPDVEPNGEDIECRECSAMVAVSGT